MSDSSLEIHTSDSGVESCLTRSEELECHTSRWKEQNNSRVVDLTPRSRPVLFSATEVSSHTVSSESKLGGDLGHHSVSLAFLHSSSAFSPSGEMALLSPPCLCSSSLTSSSESVTILPTNIHYSDKLSSSFWFSDFSSK